MGRKKNFLDFIPIISDKYSWEIKNGIVVIAMTHKGFFSKIAQLAAKTPKVSFVDLDEYGSYIWQQIDGEKTVGDIALLLREKYGDESEPLYNRLVNYMQVLFNNKFIVYKGSR
ncbi:MAG: PqqD family protein [Eubacteriales bacterium]|nr:PqqD family protein [Eubacteriales bacterium]